MKIMTLDRKEGNYWRNLCWSNGHAAKILIVDTYFICDGYDHCNRSYDNDVDFNDG